jgi:hypothetical protein
MPVREMSVKPRTRLFAIFAGLGLALAACGDDTPFVPKDGGPGSDGGNPNATLTSYVIDLITNHSADQAPAAYADFKDLPDPDGDTNNGSAYSPLFP